MEVLGPAGERTMNNHKRFAKLGIPQTVEARRGEYKQG
jgi:hypothetical protein